jgi:hypothetical protein
MSTATPPLSKWRRGDKALFEHRLVTISDIRDGVVCRVTDGVISSGGGSGGGFNDRGLFPVSHEGLRIAEFYEQHERKLRNGPGDHLLNWPELAKEINTRFNENMVRLYVDGWHKAEIHMMAATEFFRDIEIKVDFVLSIKSGKSVEKGFRLFGR